MSRKEDCYCGGHWHLPVGPGYRHPQYGVVSGVCGKPARPPLERVAAKMYARVKAGKPANLSKAEAVVLLDFLYNEVRVNEVPRFLDPYCFHETVGELGGRSSV